MMRYLWLPVVGLYVSACVSTSTVIDVDPAEILIKKLHDEDGKVMVVAHRACWSNGAPENSLSAIKECISIGADMIEIDVAITRDGVPVLFHDKTVDRTTDGNGEITSLNFSEVRQFRLKAGAGGTNTLVTEERVPTLKEALELTAGKILINLDVKGDIFSQAFEVVEHVGVEDQILMKMGAAPDDPQLVEADFVGKTLFMPIIRECTDRDLNRNCTSKLSEYAPKYGDYDPVAFEITYTNEAFFEEGVNAMTNAGGRIWVNTLSPPHAAGIIDDDAVKDPDATWGRVIRLGANMIQTDNPNELISYLEQEDLR